MGGETVQLVKSVVCFCEHTGLKSYLQEHRVRILKVLTEEFQPVGSNGAIYESMVATESC